LEEYKRNLFLGRAFQPAPPPTLAFRFEQTERLFFASLTMHCRAPAGLTPERLGEITPLRSQVDGFEKLKVLEVNAIGFIVWRSQR